MRKIATLLSLFSFFVLYTGCKDKEPEETVKPYLRVNASEKLMSNAAGSFNILVSSNVKWNVETKNAWLKSERTSGDGDMSVKITYEANTAAKRSGVVRFTAKGVNPVELIVTQSDLTFANPIGQIPDPWIVKHGDYYYVCKAQGNGINVSRSDKLSVISATKQIWKAPYDAGGVTVWNPTNVWAPELHCVDGRWYIYYAAGRPTSESNGSYKMQRAGVLRAKTDDPMGAWEDMGMLYTGDNYQKGIVATAANTAYAIDMGVFYLKGQLYAIWSGNPPGSGDQWLYIATMENPYTISSSRVAISKPDKSWETVTGKVNEGPAFLKNKEKGKFLVIYSCNGSWTKQYRLASLELSDTLANPLVAVNWKKSANEVFFRLDDTSAVDGVNGVGHCSFTKSPDETEDWIVYHVKSRNNDGWDGRYTFIQKFGWKTDGTPDFGTPVAWGEAVALPAGESR
ncbi:MAG: family 43 glycosylhydrolase [Prevotellaceae bacterium]|jgi:GH43 family beta-xylosidase|nr:family 43 glycosylhydrolase [Prevotellaceae bacterium]